MEIWGKAPEELTLTYVYLKTGEEMTRPLGDPEAVRARVETALDAIADGSFDPTPGPACRYCDFRAFCDEGQAWVAANA